MNSNNSTKENSPTITVAISALACNLGSFIRIFNFSSLSDADEVIIVIQGESDNLLLDKLEQKYIVIIDKGLGVSRSRNLALERSQSDFIWFMDDDVIIKENAILKVKTVVGYDTRPNSIITKLVATDLAILIVGVNWENGKAGVQGSLADSQARSDIASASEDIASKIATALNK